MNNKQVLKAIEELLAYAQQKLSLDALDAIYARNAILAELDLQEPEEPTTKYTIPKEKMIEPIIQYACNVLKKFEDTPNNRIQFEAKLFGFVTPSPSNVAAKFDQIAANDCIEKATNYLFDLSKNNNYVRMVDIEKNIQWSFDDPLGTIKITINLSKPEKDPKEILAAKNAPDVSYPKCALCKENLGFPGNAKKAARQTIRLIKIPLNNEEWYLQYSPYQYYEKHLIALSGQHSNMKVDSNTFIRLLDFVDLFPHFFIGSNAALPIVGGSILSHDHYQGGAKVLPMMSATPKFSYTSKKYEDVTFSIVDWYNSVIRITGKNRKSVLAACNLVNNEWQKYSNNSINILAFTDDTPHNAVTPVFRKEDDLYVVDLILRNNRCDETHPYGIFHPIEKLHNIKKEGIGIIEVMGLFILPGRLKNEIEEMKKLILGEIPFSMEELSKEENPLNKHLNMILELGNKAKGKVSQKECDNLIYGYINNACKEILLTTGVFKQDDVGEKAFNDFMINNLKLVKE